MLNEEDRDPSDEQAVLTAILAAREVYSEERFQAWAEAWVAGRDRTQHSADTTATAIRLDWFLPDPDGKKWEQRLIELRAKTATDEEFHHSALAALELQVQAESRELPNPADTEAEANMLAFQSALGASLAAYAYASVAALDLDSSDERATDQVREALQTSVLFVRAAAASCKRLRGNESDD
jgi:hypothetical protein